MPVCNDSPKLTSHQKRILLAYARILAQRTDIKITNEDGTWVPFSDLYRLLGVKAKTITEAYLLLNEQMMAERPNLRNHKPSGHEVKSLMRKEKKKAAKQKRFKNLINSGMYRSEEWRVLRFRALEASDGCCVLCGRSKAKHGVVMHVDHIKPKSAFPELAFALSNLQVLCEDCNLGKGARSTTDYRSEDHPHREK